MVLVVCGALVLLAAVHFRRTHTVPPGATPVTGRVVHVVRSRSAQQGGPRWRYGPTIEYRDPVTGALTTLPPASRQAEPVEVGDELVVMHHAPSGRAWLPLSRPRAQTAMPFVLAALVLGLGVWDLLG